MLEFSVTGEDKVTLQARAVVIPEVKVLMPTCRVFVKKVRALRSEALLGAPSRAQCSTIAHIASTRR
jgi:hypothetical protein